MNIEAIAPNLTLAADGIWYSSEQEAVSYPAEGNDDCFAVEDRSFWFRHRNRCIASVVASFPPPGMIFDVGGGNGFVSMGLRQAGFDVALVEPGPTGARNAKRRGLETVICATTDTAGVKQGSVPAIGLFDVVEHIADADEFLKSIRSLLVSGGMVYATVPAFDFLWSREDVDAGHVRRYTLGRISDALGRAGLDVLFASYIFRVLPLPIFLIRSLPYRLGIAKAKRSAAEIERHHGVAPGAFVARSIGAIFDPEVRNLEARKPMRFGGSCLVVARAP
jgi:SAM-dependent methyltransferase